MDSMIMVLSFIGGIAFLFYFKKPINRIADHVDREVTAWVNDADLELLEETKESYERFKELFPDEDTNNIIRPVDLNNMMTKKRRVIQAPRN